MTAYQISYKTKTDRFEIRELTKSEAHAELEQLEQRTDVLEINVKSIYN